jgi:rhodanese-related sulfurtransferase
MTRLLAIGLVLVALFTTGCAGSESNPAASGGAPAALAREVDPAEAAALQEGGALVLDVREPAEWAQGHVPGATLIPLGELAARTGELPRDRSIVVICRSGNRSAQGRDILLGAGFAAVTSVRGGVSAWAAAGLPLEPGA